jgi:hypothetical protein
MQQKTITVALDLQGTLQLPDGRDVPNAWVWIATLANAGAKFRAWEAADVDTAAKVRQLFAEQDLAFEPVFEDVDYYVGLKCLGCPTTFDNSDPTLPDFVDWENVGDMILRHLDVLNGRNEFEGKEADQPTFDAG